MEDLDIGEPGDLDNSESRWTITNHAGQLLELRHVAHDSNSRKLNVRWQDLKLPVEQAVLI